MAQHILTYKDNALEKNGGLVSLTLNIDPTLENNTWDTIAKAFKLGVAPSGWLGQTKQTSWGAVKTWQVVDMTKGRYDKVGGGKTNGVIMSTTLLTDLKMFESATNVGGYSVSNAHALLQSSLYSGALNFVKAPQIKVKSGVGNNNSSDVAESINKLFLPSLYELTGSTNNSMGASEGSPKYQLDGSQYLSKNIKYAGTTLGKGMWWTRSACTNNATSFYIINADGSIGTRVANDNDGIDDDDSVWIPICFAL